MLLSANDGERTVLDLEVRVAGGANAKVQIAGVGVPIKKRPVVGIAIAGRRDRDRPRRLVYVVIVKRTEQSCSHRVVGQQSF